MSTNTANVLTGEGWRDNIEALVRDRVRGLIEAALTLDRVSRRLQRRVLSVRVRDAA